MQYMIPFCLLCLVVLQQTISVAAIVSFEQNPDNEGKPLPAAKRLRAPLMGRSITTTLNDDNNFVHKESNDINNMDENELIHLDKKRYSLSFIGRRRWMNLKRKGPLFG